MNSHDCFVPFCVFSAATAHGLAKQLSVCNNVEKAQVFQADIALRKRFLARSTAIKSSKLRNPCYSKRPCYRRPFYIAGSHSEMSHRAPRRNSENSNMIQHRTGEDSISCVESNKCQNQILWEPLQSPSFKPRMDSEANDLLTFEPQSGNAVQLKASWRKPHEPDSSLERFCSFFCTFNMRYQRMSRNRSISFLFKKSLNCSLFWQFIAVWLVHKCWPWTGKPSINHRRFWKERCSY